MTVSKIMKGMINSKGPDHLWTLGDFSNYSPQAVAQTLSRLARKGILIRVRKGVYHYPSQTALGVSKPTLPQVLEKTSHARRKAVLGAGSAFYNLGLTTQVPATVVVLSPSPSKTMKIGQQNVKLRFRNPGFLTNASDEEIWVFEALRAIQRIPDSSPDEALGKVIKYIETQKLSLSRLVKLLMHQPPRVRALMGAIAAQLGFKAAGLRQIRLTLHPLTHYNLGLKSSLKTAGDWNIH